MAASLAPTPPGHVDCLLLGSLARGGCARSSDTHGAGGDVGLTREELLLKSLGALLAGVPPDTAAWTRFSERTETGTVLGLSPEIQNHTNKVSPQ